MKTIKHHKKSHKKNQKRQKCHEGKVFKDSKYGKLSNIAHKDRSQWILVGSYKIDSIKRILINFCKSNTHFLFVVDCSYAVLNTHWCAISILTIANLLRRRHNRISDFYISMSCNGIVIYSSIECQNCVHYSRSRKSYTLNPYTTGISIIWYCWYW